jgi:uncharacterized protein YidB (DUF937 family)
LIASLFYHADSDARVLTRHYSNGIPYFLHLFYIFFTFPAHWRVILKLKKQVINGGPDKGVNMVKKIVIALLVVVLLAAGAVGVVVAAELFDDGDTPIHDMFSRLAERLGLTREDMLQQLLDGKTLGEVMEDQGLTREDVIGNRQIVFIPKFKQPFFDLESIADVLGMEPEVLRQAFADGQSLADVIDAQGLDKDEVLADLITYANDKIKAAQEAGHITAEQADKLLDRLENGDFGTDWMDMVPFQPNLRQRIREGFKGYPGILLEDIAPALDMEPEDLRAALKDGQTLADIIAKKGLDEEQVFEDVKAALITRLEQVLADKEQAVQRAEELLAKVKEEGFGSGIWERLLQWEGPQQRMPRFNRLPWRGPGMRGL